METKTMKQKQKKMVRVDFQDSREVNGWTDAEDIQSWLERAVEELRAYKVGVLIHEDEHCVVIADGGAGPEREDGLTDQLNNTMLIPRSAILGIQELLPAA